MHRSSSSTTPSVRTSSMADGSFKVSSLRLPTSMLPLNHCLTTAHNCNPSGETCYPLTIHMLDMLSTFPVPPPFKGGADPLDVDIVHKELTIVASFIVECLKTLSFLIEWLFYQSSRDKPPVFRLQELCKRWNIIFPWCSYVVNQIRHKDSIKEYSGLYTWIAKILAMSGIMATDYPGIDSLVIFGTPGYITLLLRMFFESVILTEDQYLRETIAHAFFFAFRVSQDEYASQIARAIEEHDSRQQGSSGSAMSLCLRHLRRQSRPKDIRMCQLRLLTFSLDKVQSACAHRPAYLISRRTIRAITLVLYRIAIGSTDSSDKHNLVHQYTSCKGACVLRTLEELFHFLWWCARNGGSVAIVMILKGNILQTMVRLHLALGIGSSSESEGCTTTSRFFKLLLEALTIYLTSEAVLRQLSKSLELRSLKKLEKQLEESSDDLWKDWYNFRAEAHTRITIWYMYQMTRRSQACHSERVRSLFFLFNILTVISVRPKLFFLKMSSVVQDAKKRFTAQNGARRTIGQNTARGVLTFQNHGRVRSRFQGYFPPNSHY